MNAGETGEKVTDPKGNITLKVTDRLGRIKKVTAEGKTTTYEYFDNGNKRSVQYQDGSREEFTYYKDNRLNTLINKTANGSVLESYSYTYDGAHNQTSKVDKKGTTIYTYDSLNRLETVTEPSGNVTRYEFDMAGNRTKETFTKALIVKNVLRTITSYSYNEQNRLMKYNKINEVKAEEVIVIDPCETLSQEPIYGCKYMLEHVSCISCETVQRTCKYECESCLSYQMPEVMSFARSTKEASYAVSTSSGIQLVTVEEIDYSYDGNGNLINESKTSGITSNLYDEFNQLKETVSGGTTVRAKYNAEGKRVEKEVNGVKTRFLYEGDKITLELSDTGVEIARNIYGSTLIQRKMSGQVLKYFYNGHADVTALMDDAGAIVASYYYDAFGNIVEETGTVQNPYRYSGYEYDKETKNYYLQSRYYNPKIARFLSEDTYRGDRKDPLSLNLYTYCHNEPIMYVDPDGHWLVDAAFLVMDVVSFIKKPSWGNAAWIAADIVSFADPSGAASAAAHAAKGAKTLAKGAKTLAKGTKTLANAVKTVKKAEKIVQKAVKIEHAVKVVKTVHKIEETQHAVKNATKAVKLVKETHKIAEVENKAVKTNKIVQMVKNEGKALSQQFSQKLVETGKAVPNPNGKKGGIPHQNKISEVIENIKDRGLKPETEYKYDTKGGYKNSRYADVVGLDRQGRVAEVHQVGRSTKKYGSPVSRERKAIKDIRGSSNYNGARIKYHPYN